METRRRGRDARASSENNRSSSPNAESSAQVNAAIVEPPPTRSRTRRASASQRSLRSTRAGRSSSSAGIVTRSTSAVAASSSPAPGALDNGPDRTAKRPSFRRRPLQSTSTVSNFTTRVPVTRKRTRSASRIDTEPSRNFSSDASGAPAPLLSSAANSSRPSKRPRRIASTGTLAKSTQNNPDEAGPAQSGVLSRRTKSMSSSRTGEDGDGGNSTPGNLRQDEEGPDSPESDRGNPTTLQGLLRRLGADLSDILPGNASTSHSRLQQLRTMIASPENTDQQVDALSELCEFLSVGTEESLVSFSVNLFVGPLVNLLRTGSNVEVKIYAARALTHMMEALPSSASAIAINGAADPLCQNLLSIEYIDLAEQSLSVLHKLSVDYPQQIVSANGFQAVLSFIDFFSIGVQRVAASTVCNLCRLPRGDAMEMISGALPTMMRLLSSDDQRIRESAVLGFTRLAEAFKASSEKLEALCGKDSLLLDKILGLIVPSSPPAISPQSYSSALRLLALLSRGSSQLGLRILSTRSLILKLQVRLGEGSSMHSLDCLNLADSLLPDISEAEGVSGHTGSTSTRSRRRRSVGSVAAVAAADTKRREQLEQEVELLKFFGRKLFDTLMKFYVSSADSNARRLALSIMSKFIAIASEDVLSDTVGERRQDKESLSQMISPIRFCPFVAALLGENSSKSEALVGLAMAAAALQKLPSFKENFVREGVVHEIVRLASLGHPRRKQSKETSITRSLSGSSSENHCGSQEGDRPDPESSLSAANLAHSSPNVRELEFVWSAVAALQRGALNRVVRGDTLANARRLPSRPILEFRARTMQSVQDVVPRAAQSILTTFLGADADGNLQDGILKNSVLQKLLNVCNMLKAVSPEKETCETAVEGLFDLLTASEGLTVFELSRSGILEILSTYLSPTDSKSKAVRISSLTQRFREETGSQAFSALVTLALGVLSSEEKLAIQINESSHGTTTASVSSGLRQLTQPFKLRLRKAPSETGPGGLRDYSHHVVLIEPLATMASVQEFLWPRVRESSNQSGVRRQRSTLRHRSADEDGVEIEGGSGDGDDNQESDYREDRYGELLNVEEDNNEVENRMEEDGDEHNSEGSDEDVSSGEEDVIEQEGGESDEHDHDGADALDVDQLGSSLPPFEVDHDELGEAPNRFSVRSEPDPARGSASSIGSEVQRSDTTFRSYAAALAANMPRSAGEEATTNSSPASNPGMSAGDNRRSSISSDRRLLFTLNGRPLHHNSSILTAVIQSASEGSGMGPRLWSEVHTLSYSKYQEEGTLVPYENTLSRSDNPGSGGSNDGGGPVRRSLRLQESKKRLENDKIVGLRTGIIQEPSGELLSGIMASDGSVQAPSILRVSALPASVSAVVNVLRILYWIYQKLKRGYRPEGTHDASIGGDMNDATVKFVSHRLSAKLMRQLSDPLALCGDVIPPWCFTLTREVPFLIPFEARRILFQSTSLGVPRALHLLQTRGEMAGLPSGGHRSSRPHREGEARIARITRQKVRVHRNRILESAIKVMNMYSSHGTVLEVEYFGEVGTGLGPTLEFYTLASREIQRNDLGLWRCSTGKEPIQKDADMLESEEPSRKSERIPARTTMLRRSNRRIAGNITAKLAHPGRNEESPAFVIPTGNGLFPSCLPLTASTLQTEFSAKTTALFAFVGRLVGKAMIDGRLLDLRFSATFSRLLLSYCRVIYEEEKTAHSREGIRVANAVGLGRGKRPVRCELQNIDRKKVWETFTAGTSIWDLIMDVDSQLANSLRAILDMVRNGQEQTIPSLFLTFVLPGNDHIELVKDGTNKEVNAENAEDFVRRVIYHVLFGGVYQQAEALLRGLEELIDTTNLLVFEDRELELFICGPAFEKWNVEYLVQATRCDHGYNHESSSVLHLLKIMSELDEQDQQKFVRFITGSPALPLGGLRNLHPRLTIVRRTPEAGRSPDECLPTVMTCTNYLKLPDYSSFGIAKKQIMYAVREGQGAFHLS